jgi:hypothetical protein
MINKKVVAGVMILGVVIISISFVSAGFLDFIFGEDDADLEGELPETFEASVSLQNAPPIIVTVYDVIDNDGGAIGNSANPIAESINNVWVEFLASDPNGNADLPGGTNAISQASTVGELGTGGVNIEVNFTSPIFSTSDVANAGSCVRLPTCPNSNAGAGCPANDMEYRCTIPIQYYYEPGTNNWQVVVGVADVGAGTGVDGTKTFTYNQLTAFKISNVAFTGLIWTGVDLGSTNQLPTNDPLELKNIGNVNYIAGDITGYNLPPGGGNTGDDIPVNTFSANAAAASGTECNTPATADALSNGVPVGISAGGAVSLIYGDGSGGAPVTIGEELHFCLWEQLDTLGLTFSESDYGTGETGGTPWDLSLS